MAAMGVVDEEDNDDEEEERIDESRCEWMSRVVVHNLKQQTKVTWLAVLYTLGCLAVFTILDSAVNFIELQSLGSTHFFLLLNTTNKTGFCTEAFRVTEFRGVLTLAWASICAESAFGLRLLSYYRTVVHRLFTAGISYTIVWTSSLVAIYNDAKILWSEIFLCCVVSYWGIEVLRTIVFKKCRKVFKVAVSALFSGVLFALSGMLPGIFLMLFSDTSKSTTILFVIGVAYPIFTSSIRFSVRSSMFRSLVKSRSRKGLGTKLAVCFGLNLDMVMHFSLPGFVLVFMIEKNGDFLATIATQMLMEPISAWAFSIYHFSRVRTTMVAPMESYVSSSGKLAQSDFISRHQLDSRLLSGMVATEQVGEKVSVIFASFLTLMLHKDPSRALYRLIIATFAEVSADILKNWVYNRKGVRIQEKDMQQNWRNAFASTMLMSCAGFATLSGLFLSCRYIVW